MTETTLTEKVRKAGKVGAARASGSSRSQLRQRFWRWHFFAGLLVVPFVILLATTGSIYILKPQIDAFEEQRIHQRSITITQDQAPLEASVLLEGLLANHPQANLSQYTLAKPDDRTVEIELKHSASEGSSARVGATAVTYWVDQYSGEVLAYKVSEKRFLYMVKKLHSELLAGNNGSYVVELVASWTIILLITGLYLWVSSAGFSLPKLFRIDWSNQTLRWRHLHGVLGLVIALPLFLILMSGLPWTQLWGSNYKSVISKLGWDGPGQEWFVTLQSAAPSGVDLDALDGGLWEISDADETDNSVTDSIPLGQIAISHIAAKEEVRSLVPPVNVIPPKPNNGVWTVRSMPADRSQRVTLHYDQYSGDQIMRIGFENHHPFERFVSSGISFHEGALFGWLNQALVLLTAISTIALSVLGFVIWWRRRPKNELSAPPKAQCPLSISFISAIVALGIFLPAAGISMLVVAVLEFVWARFWIARPALEV